MKRAAFLLLMVMVCCFAFAQGDSTYVAKAGVADVADEDPGLFLMMMILLVGFIGAFCMGLLIVFAMAAVLAALTVGGIISISFVAGLYNRSFAKGLKIFLQLIFTAGGTLLGLLVAAIIKMLWLHETPFSSIALWSTPGGLLSGFAIGLTFYKLLQYLYSRYVKPRLKSY